MIKTLLVLGAAAAALTGCTSGACDTGDSACKAGGTTATGSPVLQSIEYDCSNGSTCTWTVGATGGEIGTVDLYLYETGDTSGSCTSDPNCVDGFWTEYHNNFSTASSSGGTETKSITLDIVGSFEDQSQNVSTIFDMGISSVESQLSYMAAITDSAGYYASCYGFGHNPQYFADNGMCDEI